MKRSSLLKIHQPPPIRENLSLTSQVSFCGLPLRLDSYIGCAFDCGYCFARRRGGDVDTRRIRMGDPGYLRRMFDRAFRERGHGVLAQFLRRRVPIHFGGMSDPFQPAERRTELSLEYLKAARDYQYPIVISTRSPLIGEDAYLEVLKAMPHVVVQFSFSTTEDARGALVEPHAPSPSTVLRTMEILSHAGVVVTCRWQPLIPGFSEEPNLFVNRIATAGARHLAVEHLKVPLESDRRWKSLENAIGRSLRDEYVTSGARRDGREYLLPAEMKLPRLLAVRAEVHRAGLTFGAADNEYQYISDTEGCCSGVDQFTGFEHWYSYQLGAAVRRSKGDIITYDLIRDEWRPRGSIDRFLNSRTRLSGRATTSSATGHIRHRFEQHSSLGGLGSFAGVIAVDARAGGLPAYGWDAVHRALWKSLSTLQPSESLGKRGVNILANNRRHRL